MTSINIIALAASLAVSAAGAESPRRLDCVSPFSETATFASVAEHFGPSNVVNEQIYLGEGFHETGTIIFPSSATDRIEVLWKDAEAQRFPRTIRIRGDDSNWRTARGVSLATELKVIERLNRRPFRLTGFGWDSGGTQLSWSGGLMESETAGRCRVRARFRSRSLSYASALFRQVLGEREFSSGHPAMQELNPRVSDLWLEY